MKHYIGFSVLAVGLSSAAFAAAANPVGDVVLGFYATGGTGATTNVEVDLGASGAFKTQVGDATVLNINSVLASTYGAGWAGRSDLFFSVAAASKTGTTAGNNFIYFGQEAASSLFDGTVSTLGYARGSGANQSTPRSTVNSLFNNISNQLTAYTVPTSDAASWTGVDAPGGFANYTNVFTNGGAFSTTTKTSGKAGVDFWEMAPTTPSSSGTGTFLGTFYVNSNGDVGFVTPGAAIPEPSTYAALLGAAALGFAALRRRQQAVSA